MSSIIEDSDGFDAVSVLLYLKLTAEEAVAIRKMMATKGLSLRALLKQGLRSQQLIDQGAYVQNYEKGSGCGHGE